MFILATTELQKIPATVLSRCQHHEFRRFPTTEISRYLQKICDTENFPYEPEALTLISRQSTGAMRDALSLLDQLSSTGDKLTLAMAQTILGVATSQAVVELMNTFPRVCCAARPAITEIRPAEAKRVVITCRAAANYSDRKSVV